MKVSDTFGSVGHLLGYARVSTFDPHTDLRRDALKAAGCFRVFTDRASGTLDARKELAKVLDQLRVTRSSCGDSTGSADRYATSSKPSPAWRTARSGSDP